ncbi:MAG: right-handed parallel beta-helix repeat-containing protein [Candidatus Thorarchaeota archaeon]
MRSKTSLKLIAVLGLAVLFLGSFVITQSDVILTESVLSPHEEFRMAYTPHDAIWISNNEEMQIQAAAESWPGNGSASSPYIITGYSFNQDTQPLRIWHTDLYWIFTGNVVDSDGVGMQCGSWIEDVENGVIHDNIFRNRHSGMVIMSSSNMNITNNEVYGNTANGIETMGMVTDCIFSGNTVYDNFGSGFRIASGMTNCSIIDNYVDESNQIGISILGGCVDSEVSGNSVTLSGLSGMMIAMSHNSVISFNEVSNSSENGIELMGINDVEIFNNSVSWTDENGLDLTYSEFSTITNNTIYGTAGIGINVNSGENSSITWNTVQESIDYALNLEVDTEYFEVKFNAFVDNGADCQINDDGLGCVILCNYYSDWNSPDADLDGYVDSPYDIDGGSANFDELPLSVMGVVPEVPVTTTTPSPTQPLVIDPLLIGGAAAVAVIVGIVLLMKRR